MKPFVITVIASRNVKRLENMRWLNRFREVSSCRSRTIKLIGSHCPSVKRVPNLNASAQRRTLRKRR